MLKPGDRVILDIPYFEPPEYYDGTVYLVQSTPWKFNGKEYVVLKDKPYQNPYPVNKLIKVVKKKGKWEGVSKHE